MTKRELEKKIKNRLKLRKAIKTFIAKETEEDKDLNAVLFKMKIFWSLQKLCKEYMQEEETIKKQIKKYVPWKHIHQWIRDIKILDLVIDEEVKRNPDNVKDIIRYRNFLCECCNQVMEAKNGRQKSNVMG